MTELDPQYRGLKRIKPAVQPHLVVVVGCTCAVHPEFSDTVGDASFRCDVHAAVSVPSKILCRKEGVASYVPPGSCPADLISFLSPCPECLRGVFNDRNPPGGKGFMHRLERSHLAEDVNRQESLRPGSNRFKGLDRVNVEGSGIHVDENGNRPETGDAACCGEETVRRCDNLVPSPISRAMSARRRASVPDAHPMAETPPR